MARHDLCQDPNLLSLIMNKIDCVFIFTKQSLVACQPKTMVRFVHIVCKRQVVEL